MSFRIIRNDITKVAADAIVNTANPDVAYAAGVDGAIYEAAGADALLSERRKIGEMNVGQAAVTPAFALDAKYIIHTVGPAWVDGDHGEFDDLRKCYKNSLELAKEKGCESIAFPLIATGVYGFPKAEALRIAISVFSDFLLKSDMEIILVVFDKEAFVLSDKVFSDVNSFIDENYVSEQLKEEYGIEEEDFYEEKADFEVESDSRLSERRFGRLLQSRRKAEKPKKYSCDLAPMAMSSSMKMDAFAGSSLDERVSHIADTWQESLFHFIDERGYTDTEIYKRANVDRKLFSKIRGNTAYQPKKITAVAFALALKLNIDETKDFLGRAGYALSPSSVFDLIIEYFIEHEIYDTYTINLALFEHEQPLLGE